MPLCHDSYNYVFIGVFSDALCSFDHSVINVGTYINRLSHSWLAINFTIMFPRLCWVALFHIQGYLSTSFYQLGTFSVNGECVCGGLFAVSGEIRTHRSRTRIARSQLHRYVLFLIQSVIIKCEIQCSYKRVITLLNNVY